MPCTISALLRNGVAFAIPLIVASCAAVAPPLQDPSLRGLLAPRSYCGEVRVRVSDEQGAVSFEAIVLADPPRRAELTAVDPLGRPVADYVIDPSGISLVGAGGATAPLQRDLLPSQAWFSAAFTLIGGRLPGVLVSAPVAVRGGYRAVFRLEGLTLDVFLDRNLAPRRVVGDDGVVVTIRPGSGPFPSSLTAEAEGGRLEVVPLSLEPCDDPFAKGRP